METRWEGDQLIVTDDVSGRVIAIPRVVTVGRELPGQMRTFIERAMFAPETIHGVRIVREGPHGVGPMQMRGMLAVEHWHQDDPNEHATEEQQRAKHHARIASAKKGTYVHPHTGDTHQHDAADEEAQ